MAAETIPLFYTRVDEWNTIVVEGYISLAVDRDRVTALVEFTKKNDIFLQSQPVFGFYF